MIDKIKVKKKTSLGYCIGLSYRAVPYFFFFLKGFIYHQRGKGGNKRERETSMYGCLSHTPYWGPGLQLRHVPWLGIEPTTLWFAGWSLAHWATPARAVCTFYLSSPSFPSSVSLDSFCLPNFTVAKGSANHTTLRHLWPFHTAFIHWHLLFQGPRVGGFLSCEIIFFICSWLQLLLQVPAKTMQVYEPSQR